MPIYNQIGRGYNDTRTADPVIAGRIIALLQPTKEGTYIDIGCGTGNYTNYINQQGYNIFGIDPSDTMLATALVKHPECTFIKGTVEEMPFEDDSFDGATAMFTFHHWGDKQQGLNELYRILTPGSRVVFLSFTAAQMDGYWLAHYFPEMIKRSGELVPAEEVMCDMLHKAGFTTVTTEKYFVHEGLQDHFLYSNKYKPEQYLDPNIRKGISSFAAFADEDEVINGLKQLEQDIAAGAIQGIMDSYVNDMGDYLFYIATK